MNPELQTALEQTFKKHFPKGHVKVSTSSLGGHFLSIGLVDDVNQLSSKIRHNDPMLHRFVIGSNIKKEIEEITITHTNGCLCVKPALGSYMAMDTIKTKFRKIKGDQDKAIKAFDKWLISLKQLVIENKDNLYDNTRFVNYIPE
jgi:hypothetical protein